MDPDGRKLVVWIGVDALSVERLPVDPSLRSGDEVPTLDVDMTAIGSRFLPEPQQMEIFGGEQSDRLDR